MFYFCTLYCCPHLKLFLWARFDSLTFHTIILYFLPRGQYGNESWKLIGSLRSPDFTGMVTASFKSLFVVCEVKAVISYDFPIEEFRLLLSWEKKKWILLRREDIWRENQACKSAGEPAKVMQSRQLVMSLWPALTYIVIRLEYFFFFRHNRPLAYIARVQDKHLRGCVEKAEQEKPARSLPEAIIAIYLRWNLGDRKHE